jgi:GDPmannose 4,6-dehydratase
VAGTANSAHSKTALICGISGQDGAYLAEFLLGEGYRVVGTSRDALMGSFHGLASLGVRSRVETCSMAMNDFRSVLQTLNRVVPDEVYNLAGQSSVGLSFDQPVETVESITIGTLNLLEAIRFTGRNIRLYNAGSSECFGNSGAMACSETSPFRPRSPYAVAKAAAFWQVSNYREAYGLHACSGILFNHESPLRPERFVTQKVVRAAKRIASGSPERLVLGNLSISRDWGWAPEYVDAMWRMLQLDVPSDFVIATGQSYSLEEFVAQAFAVAGLDWRDHVDTDAALFRPTDIQTSRADPSRAADILGWRAGIRMPELAQRMMAEVKDTTLREGK